MGHATTRVSGQLSRALRDHARALVRGLPRARRGDARAVHDVRVASRRLREALPVVDAALRSSHDAHSLRRELRRLTSAFGDVRELDVAVQTLEQHALSHEWPAVLSDRVQTHIESARDHRRRRLATYLDKVDVDRLGDRLRDVGAACDRLTATALSERQLLARVRKRAREFSGAVRAVGPLYSPEVLHAARIAGKKLRYSLELLHDAAHAPVTRDLAALRAVQETLGQFHDLHVLQEHVRAVAAEAGDRSTVRALERVEGVMVGECRVLHATFLARVSSLLALGDRLGRATGITATSAAPMKMTRVGAAGASRTKWKASA